MIDMVEEKKVNETGTKNFLAGYSLLSFGVCAFVFLMMGDEITAYKVFGMGIVASLAGYLIGD